MGRYLTPSGAGAGGGSSSMRNQRHVITANTPALPIPAWAKSMLVSGCSGGQGGGLTPGATWGKKPGGLAGPHIKDAHVPLPAGVATMAIAIGAGGLGRSSGSGNGAPGGVTSITAGGEAWKIAPVGDGSAAGLFERDDYSWMPDGATAGGASPYGKGGISATTNTDNGGNASGYGAGGGYGHGTHGGDGSPGLVIIEFLEAA